MTHSKQTKQQYTRTLYTCQKDDVFLTLEIPKQRQSEVEAKETILAG
jgi:hypothetical protein